MLQYHIAFYLPRGDDRMIVTEVLDFPGVFSQGTHLEDARLMIKSALEDMARIYLEEGLPLPTPSDNASDPSADFLEVVSVAR